MTRSASLVGAVLLIGCLSAVAQASTDARVKPLLWLRRADAKADFRRHVIQQHDSRFIGVYGYAATIPGVDAASRARLMRQRRVRYIEGTSDAITSPEYGRLVDKAYDYAKRYNMLLLRYLRDHPNA